MSEYGKLKVALIGAGKMGSFHAKKLSLHPMVRFVGIFDAVPEAAQNLAAQFERCTAFSSLEELILASDAVVLASATSSHFELASQILSRGIPMLVEKPLAANSEQANKLVEIAEEKRIPLAVGHIERFNPAFVVLREYLKKQLLLKLEFKRFSPYPPRMQNDSVVFDMMIHDIDLALSLAHESPVVKVEAKGKKTQSKLHDIVKAKVVFESGLVVELEANRDYPDKVRTIVALCENHLFNVDLMNKTIDPNIQNLEIPAVDQLEQEQRNFVAAARNKRHMIVSGREAARAIVLAEQIEAALK